MLFSLQSSSTILSKKASCPPFSRGHEAFSFAVIQFSILDENDSCPPSARGHKRFPEPSAIKVYSLRKGLCPLFLPGSPVFDENPFYRRHKLLPDQSAIKVYPIRSSLCPPFLPGDMNFFTEKSSVRVHSLPKKVRVPLSSRIPSFDEKREEVLL